MNKDNEIYTQCRHELNHLRVLVQNILILGIPIVEDHFGPDRIFMDEVKPSSGKVGNNMLLELPSPAETVLLARTAFAVDATAVRCGLLFLPDAESLARLRDAADGPRSRP